MVSRGIAPPGKSAEGRSLALWMENTHPALPSDNAIWAESPYEAVRLAQLNTDPNVVAVSRGERFQVRDPKSGQLFYYSPDFKIEYHDPRGGQNRVVYEEIKPSTLASTPHVQRKAQAARVFLAETSGNRKVSYRIVSEAAMGPDVFKAAKN